MAQAWFGDRQFWYTLWKVVFATLVVYWLGMFITTHVPSEYVDIRNMSDKVLHTSAYAGLAFLLAAAVVRRTRKPWFVYLILFAIVVAYGAFDEISQQLSPGRRADWDDWYCDTAGAGIGIVMFRLLQPLIKRRAPAEKTLIAEKVPRD